MTGSILDSWRALFTYLRRPVLLRPGGLREPGAWAHWLHLLLLNLLVLALLLPLLELWRTGMGLPLPEVFGQLPKWALIPLVVAFAPAIEECIFRGWLRGRPGALWLLVSFAATMGMLVTPQLLAMPHRPLIVAALGVVAALGGWVILRRRAQPPRRFVAAFAPIFYLTAFAFGVMHVMNYPRPGVATIVMVAPQLWAGLVLGYTRLRISLPASMLLHAASNSAALVLALLTGGMGG